MIKKKGASLNEPDDYKTKCNDIAEKDYLSCEFYLHVKELENPVFQKFGSTLALS